MTRHVDTESAITLYRERTDYRCTGLIPNLRPLECEYGIRVKESAKSDCRFGFLVENRYRKHTPDVSYVSDVSDVSDVTDVTDVTDVSKGTLRTFQTLPTQYHP